MRLGCHDCYLVTPDQSLGCQKRFFVAPDYCHVTQNKSGAYVWLPITVFDAMFVECIIFNINLLHMQVSNLIPQYYESMYSYSFIAFILKLFFVFSTIGYEQNDGLKNM